MNGFFAPLAISYRWNVLACESATRTEIGRGPREIAVEPVPSEPNVNGLWKLC